MKEKRGYYYLIRDLESKKPLIRENKEMFFNTLTAAKLYINSMNFGLARFYEIYDLENQEVVYEKS